MHAAKMNAGNESSLHCSQLDKDKEHVFMEIGLVIEFLGLPGTIISLWIFCCYMKSWKPHTLFLFNLVLADFLVLINVPFRIDTHLRGKWVFGRAWCRISLFMLTVNRSASIAFMTAVALDRYFKVLHPHHCISRITSGQAGWLAGLIWAAVVARGIPLLTTNLYHEASGRCRSFNSYEKDPVPIKLHYTAFIVEFLLPWFLLLFCSAQIACRLRRRRLDRQARGRRAIKAVVVIILVFTLCFMPSVITGLVGVYIKIFYPDDCYSYTKATELFKICIVLTYLNSALDPIVYTFSSSMFHDALKNSICFKKFYKLVSRTSSNS